MDNNFYMASTLEARGLMPEDFVNEKQPEKESVTGYLFTPCRKQVYDAQCDVKDGIKNWSDCLNSLCL